MNGISKLAAVFLIALSGLSNAQAKTFRVAALYADTMMGHFNCTCNQEAACMTRAVVQQAKSEGLNVSFTLVTRDHNLFSTLEAAKQIAQEKYDAVVGTLVSTDAIVAGTVFEEAGIPFIAPTATNPRVTEGKKFVTRIPFNDYQQSHLLAKLASQELKATSVAIIRNTSQPYSDFLGKQFAVEIKKINPAIRVREFPIFEGFTAFSSLIDKVVSEPTDLIFVPVMQASIANVYVALESKKAELTLLSSDTIEGQPKFIDLLGARSGRIRFIYPKHWNDKVEGPESVNYLHLHKKYCAKYPHSMTTIAAYDAASVLVRTVKENPELRGEKVIEAIHRMHFHGMAGPLVYGKQNDPIKPLELFVLRGNRGVHWRRWE